MHTLRNINLNLLVILHELLIERSVSRAAKKLSMSQPAVSHALAQLRRLLNDELFLQVRRGIQPTAKALELQASLERALYTVKEVINGPEVWEPASIKRTFHMAISDYGAYLFLPLLLPLVRQNAPGVEIICSLAEHHAISRQVTNGSIHMGFCIPDSAYENLCTVPLYTDRFICLAGPQSDLADKGRLTLEEYLALPHMIVSTSEHSYTDVDILLSQQGLQRHIAAVIPHYAVAARAMVDTDMILTLPYRLARALPDYSKLSCFPSPVAGEGFSYSLIWHPRSQDDAGHTWLRNLIVKVGKLIAEDPL